MPVNLPTHAHGCGHFQCAVRRALRPPERTASISGAGADRTPPLLPDIRHSREERPRALPLLLLDFLGTVGSRRPGAFLNFNAGAVHPVHAWPQCPVAAAPPESLPVADVTMAASLRARHHGHQDGPPRAVRTGGCGLCPRSVGKTYRKAGPNSHPHRSAVDAP